MSRLLYARHFLLLSCFAGVLAALNRPPFNRLFVSFAMYGALHACALVFALRSAPSARRRILFIGIGALLSALTLGVGLTARRLIGDLPDGWGLYVPLALSSAIGTLTYGVLIRAFWIPLLTLTQLAAIALGCLAATFLAYFTLGHSVLSGPSWLAVWWWYALSAGLWCCDGRRRT